MLSCKNWKLDMLAVLSCECQLKIARFRPAIVTVLVSKTSQKHRVSKACVSLREFHSFCRMCNTRDTLPDPMVMWSGPCMRSLVSIGR